jgi:hypothetical protein
LVGEPAAPLLVHSLEIGLVVEDEGGLHHAVDRALGRLQNRLNVSETLARLFLDRFADDVSSRRIERALARDEDEAVGLHGLAVPGETFRSVVGADDLLRHGARHYRAPDASSVLYPDLCSRGRTDRVGHHPMERTLDPLGSETTSTGSTGRMGS